MRLTRANFEENKKKLPYQISLEFLRENKTLSTERHPKKTRERKVLPNFSLVNRVDPESSHVPAGSDTNNIFNFH